MEIHISVQNAVYPCKTGTTDLVWNGKTAFAFRNSLRLWFLCSFWSIISLPFFFEYCKSPLKAVFRNSTLKPRISTLPVLPKYLTSLNKCISIFHPQKNYILFFLRARSVLNQCTPESTVGCPSSINTEISGGLREHPSRGEVWFQRSFKTIVMVIFKNKLLAKM